MQKLYKELFKRNLYTRGYGDFLTQFQSPEKKRKLYEGLVQKGLYTKGFNKFISEFDSSSFLPQTPSKYQETGEQKNALDNIPLIGDFLGDMVRAGKAGQYQSMAVDESIELMKGMFGEGDVKDKDIVEFINAYNQSMEAPTSDEMESFNEIYEEEGKGLWGFVKGVVNNPTVAPQLFVSSMSALIGSAADSEEVLAAAGIGAAGGAAVGGIGAIPGALGAVATMMESSLTFAELLREEVGEDNEFTLESVRAVLNDPAKYNKLWQRAVSRGVAIGVIEGMTGSIAGRAAMGTLASKGASTLKRFGAGVGVEAAGGSFGEIIGRVAAGQEMDIAEIGFEGIAGTSTAPLTVLPKLLKKPSYKINKQDFSGKEFIEKLNEMTPATLRKAKIKIENDDGIQSVVAEKQQEAYLDATIPNEVKNKKTRQEIVELEKEYLKIKDQTTVSGNLKASEIRSKIKELTQGTDVDATTILEGADFIQHTSNLQQNLATTKAYAKETGMGFIRKKNKAEVDQLIDEINSKIKDPKQKLSYADKNSPGQIIQDPTTGDLTIIINDEVASQIKEFTVGQHELLHGLLNTTLQNNDKTAKKLGKELKNYLETLDETQIKNSEFLKRFQLYKKKVAKGEYTEAAMYEEVLTLASEAMANKDLKFNETFIDKIADYIRQFFRKHLDVDIEINDAKDVYNFIKDYNKSFEEGKLYKSIGSLSKRKLTGKFISDAIPSKTSKIVKKPALYDSYRMKDSDRKSKVNKLYQDNKENWKTKNDPWLETEQGKQAVGEMLLPFLPKIEDTVKSRQRFDQDTTQQEREEQISDLTQETALELLKHIKRFDPSKQTDKVKDIDAYINSYLADKFGVAAKRIQKKERRVTEYQKTKAETKADDINNEVETKSKQLDVDLEIGKDFTKKVNNVVKKTITRGVKLAMLKKSPKQIRQDFQKIFRKAIFKELKSSTWESNKEVYKKWLESDKLKTLYENMTIETLTKRFRPNKKTAKKYNEDRDLFVKPAINPKTGKQFRITKTNTSQPGVWTKQNWNDIKDLAVQWSLTYKDKNGNIIDLPASTIGTRKDKWAETISEALSFEKGKALFESESFLNEIKDEFKQNSIRVDNELAAVEKAIDLRQKLAIADIAIPAKEWSTYKPIVESIFTSYVEHGLSRRGIYNTHKQQKLEKLPPPAWVEKLVEELEFKIPDKTSSIFTEEAPGRLDKKTNAAIDEHSDLSEEGQRQKIDAIKTMMKNTDSNLLKVLSFEKSDGDFNIYAVDRKQTPKDEKGKKYGKGHATHKELSDAAQNQIKKGYTDPLIDKLGIDVSLAKKGRMMSSGGIMNTTWNKLSDNNKNKIKDINFALIEKYNQNNRKLQIYFNLKKAQAMKTANAEIKAGLYRVQKAQTNNIGGWSRAFVALSHVEVIDGKYQGRYVGKNIKTGKVESFNALDAAAKKKYERTKINTSHPHYALAKKYAAETARKQAKKLSKLSAKKRKEYLEKQLLYQLNKMGEHLQENTISMNEFDKLNHEYANGKVDEQQYRKKAELITDNMAESLNTRALSSILDGVNKVAGMKALKLALINKPRLKNIISVKSRENFIVTLLDEKIKQIDNHVENSNMAINKKQSLNITQPLKQSLNEQLKKFKNYDKALEMAKRVNPPEKGASIIDFDEVLATTKSKIHYTIPRRLPDGRFNWGVVGWGAIPDQGSLTPAEFAQHHERLAKYSAKFDYSEFNEVKGGKKGPFFDKAKALKNKFGNSDIFIVSARPQKAAPAMQAFLKGIGLDIKIENIIGLEDGRPEAKAEFIVDRAAEGYNNFLFADDQIKNVKAVDNVLSNLDVKGKTYQVNQKFSLGINKTFNKMLSKKTGFDPNAKFSDAAAKTRGARSDSFWKRIFVPPGAEDFLGLLYNFIGEGKQGDIDKAFFKKTLLDPLARGIQALNIAKQRIATEYSDVVKKFPKVKKKLLRATDYNNFTYDQALRVYLWNKNGIDIPGLSKRDTQALIKIVKADPDMIAYADNVSNISKLPEGYTTPDAEWLAGTIDTDLKSINEKVHRDTYLKEFHGNVEKMFTKDALNKIEAAYGTSFRSALEDMIHRIKTGINRPAGQNKLTNQFVSWINNAVGNIMFLNRRSAVLQTISFTNFINWGDNNPAKFMLRVLDFPQFAQDFAMLFNSPMLKQRRAGLRTDVSAADIVNQAANSKNTVGSMISYLLKKGFIFTQIADSFAISLGGASFYRNRYNTYKQQGMSTAEAKNQAWLDFQETSERAQQSSRPDLVSQQQASPLGRFILAFQNTPMQYTRIMKKAALDLINRRGDAKSHISKILYYGAVQNFIFNAMQNTLFALAFSDEEPEEEKQRYYKVANGMADTIMRGTGIYGAIASTVKNIGLEFIEQDKKGWKADHAYTAIELGNLSPPVGSKLKKMYGATQTWKFQKNEILEKGFSLDSPAYEAAANLVAVGFNIPADRVMRDVNNAKAALDRENEAWQRIALIMGWNTWNVGVDEKGSKKGGIHLNF